MGVNINKNLVLIVGLALSIFFLSLAIVFFQLSSNTLFWRTVQNSGHTIIFFFITLFAFELIRRIWNFSQLTTILVTVVLTLLLAGLTEVSQIRLQRDASTEDVLRDMAGVGLAICIIFLFRQKRKGGGRNQQILLFSIAFTIASVSFSSLVNVSWYYWQRNQFFPHLLTSADWVKTFVKEENAKLERKNGTLYVHLFPAKIASLNVNEPVSDWSDYSNMVLEIMSSETETFELMFRVHDHMHNFEYDDRYNAILKIKPGINIYDIPLQTIQSAPNGRLMQLENIAGIVLFKADVKNPIQIELKKFILH
ncbi:MAG: VanZ family protein [Gammaproteobacteria bacterium]|nr:VanZ family protein [Gammaproteobacteria bacterium]MDH5728941.1 VanZ family protein [Gammaproteobacteria bacterium]